MGRIDDARPGLAYIMARLGATSWKDERGAFIISIPAKSSKGGRTRYRVPSRNVEEAERLLPSMPPHWVHSELVKLTS
jgi:hypothetical protein